MSLVIAVRYSHSRCSEPSSARGMLLVHGFHLSVLELRGIGNGKENLKCKSTRWKVT